MEGIEVTIAHLDPHPTEEAHYRVVFAVKCVSNGKTQSFIALVNVADHPEFDDESIAARAWESVATSVAAWYDRVKTKSPLVGQVFVPPTPAPEPPTEPPTEPAA